MALKEMLAILIDRLGAVAASTGQYYSRLDEAAGQIRSADDLASLSKVVANLLEDTGNMRDGMQRIHSELNAARDKAKTFEQRVQALEREGTPMSVALLDIDNFKRLNDSLGHEVGDMALRHLSALVRNSLRPMDAVARYGGEEFDILMPSTSTDMAVTVLTR